MNSDRDAIINQRVLQLLKIHYIKYSFETPRLVGIGRWRSNCFLVTLSTDLQTMDSTNIA